MPKPRLHEVILPTDRWSARAISPVDIRSSIDNTAYGPTVVLHPGWGKSPERHTTLLTKLADAGFLPIGVDTRYAYADRRSPRRSLSQQPMRVGTVNPYFADGSRNNNRLEYRRPTVLLDICERLGITQRSYIGHSEGARIVTLAALANIELTDQLVLVNGAGLGDSSQGVRRLTASNADRLHELAADPSELGQQVVSALGSTLYAGLHLRRTLAEKKIIQSTDTWQLLDQLESTNVAVAVLHAKDDKLVCIETASQLATERPWVRFVPTEGSHSNVYETAVQELIARSLLSTA